MQCFSCNGWLQTFPFTQSGKTRNENAQVKPCNTKKTVMEGKKMQKMEYKINSALWTSDHQFLCSKVRLGETPRVLHTGHSPRNGVRHKNKIRWWIIKSGHNLQGLLEQKPFVSNSCSVGSCMREKKKNKSQSLIKVRQKSCPYHSAHPAHSQFPVPFVFAWIWLKKEHRVQHLVLHQENILNYIKKSLKYQTT